MGHRAGWRRGGAGGEGGQGVAAPLRCPRRPPPRSRPRAALGGPRGGDRARVRLNRDTALVLAAIEEVAAGWGGTKGGAPRPLRPLDRPLNPLSARRGAGQRMGGCKLLGAPRWGNAWGAQSCCKAMGVVQSKGSSEVLRGSGSEQCTGSKKVLGSPGAMHGEQQGAARGWSNARGAARCWSNVREAPRCCTRVLEQCTGSTLVLQGTRAGTINLREASSCYKAPVQCTGNTETLQSRCNAREAPSCCKAPWQRLASSKLPGSTGTTRTGCTGAAATPRKQQAAARCCCNVREALICREASCCKAPGPVQCKASRQRCKAPAEPSGCRAPVLMQQAAGSKQHAAGQHRRRCTAAGAPSLLHWGRCDACSTPGCPGPQNPVLSGSAHAEHAQPAADAKQGGRANPKERCSAPCKAPGAMQSPPSIPNPPQNPQRGRARSPPAPLHHHGDAPRGIPGPSPGRCAA